MNTIPIRRQQLHCAACLAIAGILLLLAGCCSSDVRKLQDRYSDLSRRQTPSELAGAPDLPAPAVADAATVPASSYAALITDSERLMVEEHKCLQKYGLYADIMLLQALAQRQQLASWQASVPDAEEQAFSARLQRLEQHRAQLGERDRALLSALPGLRAHDRGCHAPELATAEAFFLQALQAYETAAQQAPQDHPVQGYFLLASLSTLTQWHKKVFDSRLLGAELKRKLQPILQRARSTAHQAKLADDPELRRRASYLMAVLGDPLEP